MWTNLVQSLKSVLDALVGVTGSPGLAIILLTFMFHLLLMPLTISQNRSMRKMQELQPEIQRLQKKYKDDKTRQNQETMKLWKEHGVNPMGGCLPMLVQLPIMIAVFFAIRDFEFAGQASFLWIPDLAHPDPLFILPVLAAATTFLHSKFAMPTGTAGGGQATMLYFMPLMIGYFTLRFPAGLAVYWVASNIFRIGQHFLVDRRRERPQQ